MAAITIMMTTIMTDGAYKLLAWFSPAMPIGAYSYSLVPLGQTDGQRLTAALEAPIRAVAESAQAASLDDLGTASPMIDLCAIAHETQHTRLFRS